MRSGILKQVWLIVNFLITPLQSKHQTEMMYLPMGLKAMVELETFHID